MLRPTPSLEAVRAAGGSVCGGYAVRRMEVFGSGARGDHHPGCDIDLLVEFLPGASVGLFEMGALKEDLEDQLGCPVDLVSRKAVEKSKNPYRRQSILADSVTVYVH